MTSAADTPTDDIAYVRKLAESAARAPLIGGRFMAWWGFLVTAAYGAQHLANNGAIGDGETVYAVIWIAFGIAGGLGQAVLKRTMPPLAGSGTAGNRAMRAAWITAAGSIFAMVVGAIVASARAGPAVYDWIVPLAFAVYACAQIVTGVLAGNRILVTAGYGAILMVGVTAAFVLYPDRYLIAAAGAALTVMLPGVLLLRGEQDARGDAA